MVHQGLVKTQVLFLYHCGILRAIARVALQLNPCGLALRYTSKLVHFAITPVGYESLMVHQKDSRNRESF